MFDIGFWELMVVGVVALVVIGPKDLPRVARLAGLWLGRARRTLATVKDEIDREFKAQELQDILKKQAQGNPLQRILEEPVVPPPAASRPDADAEPGRHLSEPPERIATKS
ncbi:Sec-independent protein translocase protein TatB [Candidatus Thiodictyon syntrophicum]|jgi:sec-independent protein translocase protein TatB|uniref:Sec-independent protein translocase protein TatB n=1 Tax=Candidatus Thiodictyon syntrophicum TaxID=1166950 RepID=A0A2K8U755_9GAMM|nr:Sec-independent protein translocase protein TatB [Candidatus Thiodictyon syntrophicum]AUB80881.1 twin arginine-targeting protein translocase TatB [Candidatus Thiodictyon syntrophicum]